MNGKKEGKEEEEGKMKDALDVSSTVIDSFHTSLVFQPLKLNIQLGYHSLMETIIIIAQNKFNLHNNQDGSRRL